MPSFHKTNTPHTLSVMQMHSFMSIKCN